MEPADSDGHGELSSRFPTASVTLSGDDTCIAEARDLAAAFLGRAGTDHGVAVAARGFRGGERGSLVSPMVAAVGPLPHATDEPGGNRYASDSSGTAAWVFSPEGRPSALPDVEASSGVRGRAASSASSRASASPPSPGACDGGVGRACSCLVIVAPSGA